MIGKCFTIKCSGFIDVIIGQRSNFKVILSSTPYSSVWIQNQKGLCYCTIGALILVCLLALHSQASAYYTNDFGGVCPQFDRPDQLLDHMTETLAALGLTSGEDIFIGLNCAAHELYDPVSNPKRYYGTIAINYDPGIISLHFGAQESYDWWCLDRCHRCQ